MVLALQHPSGLFVRWIHILGMAVLFGGVALTWVIFSRRFDRGLGGLGILVRTAVAVEWVFWGGIGVLVMTGVGNLGSFAPAVPGPQTAWGGTFVVKLGAVVGLVVGSVVRTLFVVRLLAAESTGVGRIDIRRLRVGYAVTAVYLVVIVALAEVLAHG